ncbi:MAG: RcnB family protein [Sphingomicrobium sp.]
MRKFILLAAMAAIIVPTAATAQRNDRTERERIAAKHVQKVRQNARQDRRAVSQVRKNVRQDRRVVRQVRQNVRQDRRAVSQVRRNTVGRNRSAYIAPMRNWRYRPVNVGYRLQPSFYGSRYYISDYRAYHLQTPHGRWLRWIRYGNDLLLVNIRTGRVLNVVHYRYW